MCGRLEYDHWSYDIRISILGSEKEKSWKCLVKKKLNLGWCVLKGNIEKDKTFLKKS